MSLSYWEIRTWFSDIDFVIIGSGITGLSCALHLKKRFPGAGIIILERGLIPKGASTKNAGFACFGSLSEILDDLKIHTEDEVLQLVERRVKGLEILRNRLGDDAIAFKAFGGYELFSLENEQLFRESVENIGKINELLKQIFGDEVFRLVGNDFGFSKVQDRLIFNKFEAQLNTGKMMSSLLQMVHSAGIKILNNINVEEFIEEKSSVRIRTNQLEISAKKLFIATNGFASQLGIPEVKPGRGQVLITKPLSHLKIKGNFHFEKSFYYFRNVDNRILLGGGRNLAFEAEETTEIAETTLIQEKLEELLKFRILPDRKFKIEHRWSGIMGVGDRKEPVIRQISENVYCGVRLGGMGVAIGSLVGKEMADLL